MTNQDRTAPLWAGVASEDITPPPGIRLSGFAGRPTGGNTGHHDRLRASALYLRDNTVDGAALILTLDIIGLSPVNDADLRFHAGSAAGVSRSQVFIACSHTHGGPATMTIRATGDEESDWVKETLLPAVIRAARSAARNAEPVSSIREGASPCDAAINRRARFYTGSDNSPDAPPIDRDCRTLLLEKADGQPLAALFHYAMHPVTRGRTTEVSADWVAAARDSIETALNCPALYLQGCCGDINPGAGVAGNPEEADRFMQRAGQEVAEAMIAATRTATPIDIRQNRVIASGFATAQIPLTPLPNASELQAIYDQAAASLARTDTDLALRHIAEADQEWVRACRLAPPNITHQQAEVSALRIGSCLLIGLPGEIFTEIGMAVRRETSQAWPVGFTNGNLGYLYPDSALAEGGYEVDLAYKLYGTQQAGTGTADALVKAAREAVAKMPRD